MRPSFGRALKVLVLAAAMLAAPHAWAKTTGVVEDPAVQSGPCYDALVDKNAANPTTAPNRELGAACAAEHGDVDKAWARVIRLWGSDSVELPDYSSYRPADAPLDGTMPRWLAWAGLLLAYAALGTPMRAAAHLMNAAPSSAPSGTVVEVVACLVLRALVAAVLVALLALPFLMAVCGVALVVVLLVDRGAAAPPATPRDGDEAAGPLARHLAEIVNDVLGAAAGLAAVALFVQHSVALFVVGVLLAVVASAGPVIAGRRALRSTRVGVAASRALLAACLGEALILTPPFVGWLGGLTGATLAVPLLLAAATLAVGLRDMVPAASPAG